MEREPRAEKVAVVDEVRERFDKSTAVVLTEYRGINVAAMEDLRRKLREAGGDYKVYKNTLVRLAVAERNIDGLADLLVGPTALAFVDDDAAAVAKALKDFAGTNDKMIIKGALLGDQMIDEAGVRALADLPSRDQLLAQIAGAFQAPMSKFAALLQAPITKFAYGLQALIQEGGASGAPASDAAAEPEATDD
jgi:large subunit ribosomal protein L10